MLTHLAIQRDHTRHDTFAGDLFWPGNSEEHPLSENINKRSASVYSLSLIWEHNIENSECMEKQLIRFVYILGTVCCGLIH